MEIGSIYILIRLTTYFFKLHSLAKVINNLCIEMLTRQTQLERYLVSASLIGADSKFVRLTDSKQLSPPIKPQTALHSLLHSPIFAL